MFGGSTPMTTEANKQVLNETRHPDDDRGLDLHSPIVSTPYSMENTCPGSQSCCAPEHSKLERAARCACCVLVIAAGWSAASSLRAASFEVLYSFPTNSAPST